MLKRIVLSIGFLLCMAGQAAAQSTVFIVRHAERADDAPGSAPTMAADPELSAAGRTRAESLAAALRDASITAVFATEFKRSQQTAAPLAKGKNIATTTVSSKEPSTLVQKIKATRGNVLVVGHSNTIPELLKALGIETPVKIGDTEYDHLFVVIRSPKPTMVHLHYR